MISVSDLYEIQDNNFNYYHYQPGSNINVVYCACMHAWVCVERYYLWTLGSRTSNEVAQTTGPHAHTQLIHLPPSSCKGTAAGRSRTTTSAGWPNDVWGPMVEWPSVGVVFPSSARSL